MISCKRTTWPSSIRYGNMPKCAKFDMMDRSGTIMYTTLAMPWITRHCSKSASTRAKEKNESEKEREVDTKLEDY